MFTGIVQAMGVVRRFTRRGDDALLEIETSLDLADVKVGDSIAVGGACLTVTARGATGFTADVSAETLARTTLKAVQTGEKVNLEKALRLTDFLGGHLVLGHVDGVGTIREKTARSGSLLFGFDIPGELERYIVEKGSIAVDGVSLTVNRCAGNRFYVNMIPHTAEMTSLGVKKVSAPVNIETDIIGKYVEKLLKQGKGIDRDFLAQYGFMKP